MSLWVKPRNDMKWAQGEPPSANALFAVPVISLALVAGIAAAYGIMWGLLSFIPIVMGIVALVTLSNLAPREEPREVRFAVTSKAVRLVGEGAKFFFPFDRIAAFRVQDGERPGSTRFSFRLTEGDVVHVEVDSTEAESVAQALDGQVPCAIVTTGLRPALARRGRSLAEWREALRPLATEGGYRGGRPNVEPLLAAVRDDRLSAEERIGAALAVVSRPDTETREMLRVAAETAPTKRLRVALERVADDAVSEAEIAGALEAERNKWRV